MMTGEDVAWVQYHLVRLGCMAAKTKDGKNNIDKKYGAISEIGVMEAQKRYGIQQNGIVDARTVKILRWN